jgi:hypothetical protein
MNKYDPLYDFLKKSDAKKVILTFDDIEKIIGTNLPKSAKKHAAWWDGSERHSQSTAWIDAGFKVKADRVNEIAVFERAGNHHEGT